MLIHPWDSALSTTEWQEWLAHTDHFGMLVVNNVDPAHAPSVVPTHFTVAGEELLVHLARPNPVWPHLEAATEVRLAVIGDYAYIPTYWRAKAGGPDEDGVPTSYYTALQFVCRPTVVDDAEGKVEILAAQLGDFQPEADTPLSRSTTARTRACSPASAGCAWRCTASTRNSSTTITIRSITVAVSSAIPRSATTRWMPAPPRSSVAAWP
ncbi:FMN-binding negative transcriptional regulator [Mycolicibacterium sp.]|uniref:FMN-binding negative transcriptional regulator n=1 Tax=Mycolicibacterium sp. TaxID=2320850 RepID=UPI0037C7F1BB